MFHPPSFNQVGPVNGTIHCSFFLRKLFSSQLQNWMALLLDPSEKSTRGRYLLTKHTVEFSEILHHLVCIKPYK